MIDTKIYNKDNIFAKILRGEIPCSKIYEDEFVLAFKDINPAKKIHVLVIPKGEYISFVDFVESDQEFIKNFFLSVKKVAATLGLEEKGYRLLTNYGVDGGQTVPHFHVHILGGEKISGF